MISITDSNIGQVTAAKIGVSYNAKLRKAGNFNGCNAEIEFQEMLIKNGELRE